MPNRIENKFQQLRKRRQKAFIPFVTAGFPNLSLTEQFVLGFESAGADIVELGIPFSDPLADGPTIQKASQKALKKGVTVKKILTAVKNIRGKSQIPLALMTYYNPVFHYGQEKFIKDAGKAGVDGLIIPDLPPEEAHDFMAACRKTGMATIFFLSPTTKSARMKKIIACSTGFVYFVSLTGVTGARRSLPADLAAKVRAAKRLTDKPVCVGFGISNPRQAALLSKYADGVIVGSAIIKKIEQDIRRPKGHEKVLGFVRALTKAVKH